MNDNKIREIRIIRENPRFRRYPEYKESGVGWIGEIPSNWRSSRLKFHLSENSGGIWGQDDEFGNGIYVLRSTEITIDGHWDLQNLIKRKLSKEEAERFLLKKGDLIITKSSGSQDHIGKTGLVDRTIETMVVCYSNFVQRLRPQSHINSKFLHYFMNCPLAREQYKYQSETTTGLANLNAQSINGLFISVPPEQEQTQIVNFLDRKTEQIDELIRIKERRIELLQAQRTALINQAVTKGLDPNVEMKPSGVEWIAEIPRHWTLTRLKYVSSIPVTYGLNIEADRYTTEGIRLIRITDIDESGGLRQKGVYLSEDCVPQEQMLNSYDLLLSRSGATVGKSYLHLEKGKYTSAGYLVRFNFDDYWASKFIYYVTLSHFYRNWLEQQIIISTIQNVNGEKYSNFQLPIPLYQEHKQIVDFLDRRTEQINDLISAEQRKIELLKEYRQSLISEAVTGKIDVRTEV